MSDDMSKNYWYAVLMNPEDDWYYGNTDLSEAKQQAIDLGPDAFVAVIDDSNKLDPKCVRYITQTQFPEVNCEADIEEGTGYTS